MLEVLQAVEDEAAVAVEDAYAQGYKAGRIDGASIWKIEYEKLQITYEKEKKKTVPFVWGIIGSFSAGFLTAGAVSFALR